MALDHPSREAWQCKGFADRAVACEELWKKAIAEDEKEMSVWSALFRSLGRSYFMAALWKPVWLAAILLQVYVLKALVHSIENRSKSLHWWRAFLLVLIMFLAVTMQSIAQNNLFSLCQRLSMRARSMINMAIYRKLLSMKLAISNRIINEGRLLNLINNDTQKLVDAGGNFHFAWFSLVEILVVSAFIIAEAGISGLPGVILVLLCQPIPILMSWVVRSFRLRAICHTDERVRLLGELIAGIKTVKLNGWTGPFLHLIAQIRDSEIYWIRKSLSVKFLILTLKDAIVPIASMLIFWTYARMHGHLTASMSFSVLALLGILARVFNFAPTGIQYAGEALAAVQRLQCFLSTSNVGMQSVKIKVQPEASILVLDGSFSWDTPEYRGEKLPSTSKDNPELVLKGISLIVQRGQLIGIIGAVGSGKSSLLLSLLGETNCLRGVYLVDKPIAYAPQKPWIFNDTVRNNILFGSKYNNAYYQKVIAACGLDYDITHLPASDDTEIGDRGVNLSGGQKARIGLARACFSSAPVVLLDDPFAAIDPQTANHLMQHVLNGVLQGRTIVVTTQNLGVLDYCDEIFMMDAGRLQLITLRRPVIDGLGDCKSDFFSQSTRWDTSTSMCHILQEQRLEETIKLHTVSDCNGPVGIHEQGDVEKLNSCTLDHQFVIGASCSLNKVKNVDKINCDSPSSVMSQNGTWLSESHNSEVLIHCEEHQRSINNKMNGTVTVEEDRVEGQVTWATLKAYLRAGRYSNFLLVTGGFLCTQAARVLLTYWLAIWADGIYHLKLEYYAGIYACIIAGATLFSATRAYMFSHVTTAAANTLHKEMNRGIFNSPLSFFEQNLSGRVLSRLSKDQACIDELLPNTAQSMLENLVGSIGSVIIIAVLVPWFLLALPPFVIVLFYFQRRYTAVSRELKRLDGVSRSPISVHFTETLQGLTSIRAYHVEETKLMCLASLLDGNNSANILFQHVSRWLSFRLDFAAAVCVMVTALLVVLLHDHIAPGIAGVILVQSLQLTGLFQYGIRMAADTENHFTNVERICSYADLQQEGLFSTPFGLISDDWPSQGSILFLNYTMAYREDLVPVLNKVTFEVRPKEKIGILGRTGAGKSSLVLALFRMVDNAACSGSIFIDGMDIKSVGLDDLRQRLSIVPQDPVLFKETIRMNLDPFQRHTDSDIFEALKAVQLASKVRNLDKGLYAVAGDDGNSFSVGECQLLCLARAILRRSRVLVMDEATSAIDIHVDNLIQTVLSKEFQSCTVLSIAHRSSTVRHCDRFLLLSHGGHMTEVEGPQSLQGS